MTTRTRTTTRTTARGAARTKSKPAALCADCARSRGINQRGPLRSLRYCRDGNHEIQPHCPEYGQKLMLVNPNLARCTRQTGVDPEGRPTWCSAERRAVSYGPGGKPIIEGVTDREGR